MEIVLNDFFKSSMEHGCILPFIYYMILTSIGIVDAMQIAKVLSANFDAIRHM